MLLGDDAPAGGRFHQYSLFVPATSIAGGSDEVQRNIIGERALGLPKEPDDSRIAPSGSCASAPSGAEARAAPGADGLRYGAAHGHRHRSRRHLDRHV